MKRIIVKKETFNIHTHKNRLDVIRIFTDIPVLRQVNYHRAWAMEVVYEVNKEVRRKFE